MNIQEKLLRMSDLANLPGKPEKVIFDKSGYKHTITAKPAKRGLIGFSAKHIYHLINTNQFPKPIKIGRASLWRSSDIETWIEKQFEGNIDE